ncbi:Succinate-semialdehyde dehydrogenase [NADP+] [Shigella dysenteriae 1617]|uniref:Succinate-semialdehyde dehydrogenase [NADP+] n=1 Tax=Shigella dysenteriae 1617 TaxID=754093 RepID=A0A0A6ZXH9_SHIDY|nr:Succinate-semialdehyde dehydrogenase [NADP+] [Shigella dysenteriae 1617]
MSCSSTDLRTTATSVPAVPGAASDSGYAARMDEADVIAQANDTEFGLAAYFYARDLSRVFRVGEALEYGIVGINTGIISNEVAPFGGIKASGLGREGSKYGIEDYLEIKYMCIGL